MIKSGGGSGISQMRNPLISAHNSFSFSPAVAGARMVTAAANNPSAFMLHPLSTPNYCISGNARVSNDTVIRRLPGFFGEVIHHLAKYRVGRTHVAVAGKRGSHQLQGVRWVSHFRYDVIQPRAGVVLDVLLHFLAGSVGKLFSCQYFSSPCTLVGGPTSSANTPCVTYSTASW